MEAQPMVRERSSGAAASSTSRRRPDTGSRLRHLSREERIFGGAVAVTGIHLADAAIEGLRFGGPASRLWVLLPLALLPVLFVIFLWRRRVVRSVLAAGLGLSTVVLGIGIYGPHLALGQAAGSDYTGVLATLAGVVLLALAFRIGLRGRRWYVHVIAIPLALVVLVQWVLYPAVMAAMHVNAPRPQIPSAQTLGLPGAADVTFLARNGVRLAAWYVPGSNGAAVIVLHGTGDSRLGTVEHLRTLASAGYAVLAIDSSGHGQSGGQPNSWGWHASDTIAGAVDFLRHQPGVDPTRIAALGLSTGAMEALWAAAEGVPLAAVIADGPGPLTEGDNAVALPSLDAGWLIPIDRASMWVAMRLTTLFSGDREPSPLVDVAGRIRVPVLIIATNPAIDPAIGHPPGERVMAEAYRERIGPNATLWYVGDVGHNEALRLHPVAYTARVTAFLAGALNVAGAPAT